MTSRAPRQRGRLPSRSVPPTRSCVNSGQVRRLPSLRPIRKKRRRVVGSPKSAQQTTFQSTLKPTASSAATHARKYSPRRDLIGRPVTRLHGPQSMNSGTFSTSTRATRSSVHQRTTCHGSMRCWSCTGRPPRARLWKTQEGAAVRRSSLPSGTMVSGSADSRSAQWMRSACSLWLRRFVSMATGQWFTPIIWTGRPSWRMARAVPLDRPPAPQNRSATSIGRTFRATRISGTREPSAIRSPPWRTGAGRSRRRRPRWPAAPGRCASGPSAGRLHCCRRS